MTDWHTPTNGKPFPPLGVGCCSWNSISERMKRRRERERKRESGGEKNHKRVDWFREGCLILVPIVIGWEVWPHLKTGLLQFNDIEISLCVCMCWRGWHSIFTTRTCLSNKQHVETSICAFLFLQSLCYDSCVTSSLMIEQSHICFINCQRIHEGFWLIMKDLGSYVWHKPYLFKIFFNQSSKTLFKNLESLLHHSSEV